MTQLVQEQRSNGARVRAHALILRTEVLEGNLWAWEVNGKGIHALKDFGLRGAGAVYVVEGPGMERLIESVNFDDLESLNWFHRTLRRLGVIDALREKGAGEGSTVRIAEMEFEFVE